MKINASSGLRFASFFFCFWCSYAFLSLEKLSNSNNSSYYSFLRYFTYHKNRSAPITVSLLHENKYAAHLLTFIKSTPLKRNAYLWQSVFLFQICTGVTSHFIICHTLYCLSHFLLTSCRTLQYLSHFVIFFCQTL